METALAWPRLPPFASDPTAPQPICLSLPANRLSLSVASRRRYLWAMRPARSTCRSTARGFAARDRAKPVCTWSPTGRDPTWSPCRFSNARARGRLVRGCHLGNLALHLALAVEEKCDIQRNNQRAGARSQPETAPVAGYNRSGGDGEVIDGK